MAEAALKREKDSVNEDMMAHMRKHTWQHDASTDKKMTYGAALLMYGHGRRMSEVGHTVSDRRARRGNGIRK